MKILVTPTSLQQNSSSPALDALKEFTTDLVFNPYGRPLSEDEAIELLTDCDGYLAGLDYISDKVISSSPKLKAISRYGAGYDRVDIKSAISNNVVVTNTPGVNAEAVGELAFSLILALARNIVTLDKKTKTGEWIRSTGMELRGKTLGIVGLGAIGKVIARCAKGFEMTILAYDPFINEPYCNENGISIETFESLIQKSDIISLHLPLNESTHHIIDASALKKMKDGSILVNTSRGGLIDEDAAYEALTSGKLRGMGLDAFEVEPPQNSPLFELDNVILTPHTGAHTKEATLNMATSSVNNLIAVLENRGCDCIVSVLK